MTRFACALALMSGVMAWAETVTTGRAVGPRPGAFAWPVEEIASRIENLSCSKVLDKAPEVATPNEFVPQSEVPLRAAEYARMLQAGAHNENAFQKHTNNFVRSKREEAKASGFAFEYTPPPRRVAINVSREGMTRAWNDIADRAWKFSRHYGPDQIAAIILHENAFARLNEKALAMIKSIRSNSEIRPVAESLAMTLAQIIDGARAAVGALDPEREARLANDPRHALNLALLWEELSDYAHLYDAYVKPSAVARFDDPEVREFLVRELKFVRRWRMYERGALASARDRSKEAAEARHLIGVRLANDWRLLARDPRMSGRQLLAFRDALKNLHHDLLPYVPARSMLPLDPASRELLLSEALDAPLLLDVIRLAGASLDADIPRSAPAPVRPTFEATEAKVTGWTWIDKKLGQRAVEQDRPRLEAFKREMREYEAAVRAHRDAEHERRYQAQALYAAYDVRSKARRILITFLALKEPMVHFAHVLGPDGRGGQRMIDVAAQLCREADADVAKAADGPDYTAEMLEVMNLARAKAPPHLLDVYGRWMVYAYATLPQLFPGLAAPPRPVPLRKPSDEYRPPFLELF